MQFAGQINGKFQTVLLNAAVEKVEYLANKTCKIADTGIMVYYDDGANCSLVFPNLRSLF